MDSLRQTIDYFGDDFVRGIIEVTRNHGGRVGYDVVAEEIKYAAHSPEFEADGATALRLFIDEYYGLMDGMDLLFSKEKNEFFILSLVSWN